MKITFHTQKKGEGERKSMQFKNLINPVEDIKLWLKI